jgi:hypothetical protein
MLLLDNSGSMAHIVPSSPSYDAATTYESCSTASYQVAAGSNIELRISSNKTYFSCNSGCSGTYDWGNASTTALNSKTKKCFIPTATYLADLNADSSGSPSGNHGSATEYSGNFLNWYFSNSTRTTGDTFASGATYKAGTLPRYLIANASAKSLVDNLSGINLGLSKYKNPTDAAGSGGGANILFNISSLTTANKTTIKSQLDTIAASYAGGVNGTYTPLASAFKEIARYYFIGNDATGTKLTLHPNNS